MTDQQNSFLDLDAATFEPRTIQHDGKTYTIPHPDSLSLAAETIVNRVHMVTNSLNQKMIAGDPVSEAEQAELNMALDTALATLLGLSREEVMSRFAQAQRRAIWRFFTTGLQPTPTDQIVKEAMERRAERQDG